MAPILLSSLVGTEPMEMSEQVSGTILVVDDDEGVRKVLTRWVADMGYTAKEADNADRALEIMREGDIDVALCDVRMPGHDGLWLLDQMRRSHPDVAAVLATGLLEMDPMVTLRPGVVGYIVKPFSREELTKVVKRGMVERLRLQAEHRARPRMLPAGVVEGHVVSRG
jgi:DNA-binding NtrC family response regulator